ncbi:MAG: OmpH family outer membrane protein [Bacteroidales bacterium]|nr:OmpH family outer membrane protein [Bacteroidales bacterium]
MKKLFFVAILAIVPFLVNAQSIKMGYINAQEIFSLMPELDSIEKEMSEYNAKNLEYMQAMEQEFSEKAEKYEQEKDKLPDAIRKVTEEELQAMYQRYQTAYQTLQAETQKKQAELIEPVNQRIRDAIEKVGKKNGYIFIFDISVGSILYKGDNAVDVSSQVKKELGIL